MVPTQTDARADLGMSLVEVMVAMALFVLGSLSLLSVLTSTLSGTFDNRARVTAANLAASDIDEARATDYYALGNADVTKVVDGRSYRVVRTVATTLASGADTSSCIGNTGSARQMYKRVTTQVEPAYRGRATPVRADTLVKAPVFDPNSARGAVALVVMDRAGAPVPSVPVSLSSTNLSTDVNGCVFFDALLPGPHTVTATKSGWVKIDGSPVLSKAVSVAAGQITSEALRIDVAVPVRVVGDIYNGTTLVGSSNFDFPNNLSARIAAPDRASVTKVEYAAKPLPGRGVAATWNSFPSPGGYDVYRNDCSHVTHTDAEPGSTPTVVRPLTPVNVWITAAGSLSRNKLITVTSLLAGCPESVTYGGNANRTNGTCSNDCGVDIAVPPGTWRFATDTSSTDVTIAPWAPATTVHLAS